VTLGAIVQIDEQGPDERKTFFDGLPPVDQAIHQAVAGDFRRHSIQKEFIGGGQENAHRGHRGRRLKVVVTRLGEDPILASPREGSDLDGGLGIE
jgi:hypothetical protein